MAAPSGPEETDVRASSTSSSDSGSPKEGGGRDQRPTKSKTNLACLIQRERRSMAPARGRSSAARHPINLFRSRICRHQGGGQSGDKRIPNGNQKGVNITRYRAFIQVPAKETLPHSGRLRNRQQPCSRDGIRLASGIRRNLQATGSILEPPSLQR
ncbi:hypothetical protein CGRA01v4_13443 [Colletotrichum graminicola]|nr:hypothetical protein CGRA01v4_13443 [Colletotrichum graminicola]